MLGIIILIFVKYNENKNKLIYILLGFGIYYIKNINYIYFEFGKRKNQLYKLIFVVNYWLLYLILFCKKPKYTIFFLYA